ncbi:unnamed protein product [Brassica rapa subsp. narinosa]
MHSASFPEKKRDEPFSNTSFEASQRTKLDMGRSNESSRGTKHNHYHSNTETSLKHEVDQLETRLEDQFKQATDLIKEIALLERVVHLEHYLLSLYRKAFDQQITPNSESKKPKSPSVLTTPTRRLDFCEEPCTTDPLLDDGRDRVDPVFTVATPSVQHLRVADLLHYFKTLISRLEEVDPSKLKHEEKLAFWINVHNALGDACKLSFFEPINLGRHITLVGHTISAEATQSSILGCKMSHPGQKFKAGGDERLAAYAINHLLHFSLTSGTHSDPPVRVYTPKRIKQELETSKEEMNLTEAYRNLQYNVLRDVVVNHARPLIGTLPALHSDILFLEKLPNEIYSY